MHSPAEYRPCHFTQNAYGTEWHLPVPDPAGGSTAAAAAIVFASGTADFSSCGGSVGCTCKSVPTGDSQSISFSLADYTDATTSCSSSNSSNISSLAAYLKQGVLGMVCRCSSNSRRCLELQLCKFAPTLLFEAFFWRLGTSAGTESSALSAPRFLPVC